MLTAFFDSAMYVRVKKNQFRVRSLKFEKEATFNADQPFSTNRQLIAQFQLAEEVLKRALKEISKSSFFTPSPHVLIQPLEITVEGLSQVEERVLREVAIGAGASKVVVWLGHELSDAEVREKLSAK
jgi:hypothetical protein